MLFERGLDDVSQEELFHYVNRPMAMLHAFADGGAIDAGDIGVS